MKTLTGEKVHVVGTGICGLIVVQVEIEKGKWRLGKILEQDKIEMFGSGDIYFISQPFGINTT